MITQATIAATDTAACQACIDACVECHTLCTDTALYCLQSNPLADANQIRMLFDCAEICRTNAQLMETNDDLLEATCAVCGMVYEHFARECDALGTDPQLQRCAEAIRACVTACENLVMAA